MEILITFLTTLIISFAGSLQPGPLNMTVLYRTGSDGSKAGYWVAAGGMIPEALYSAAAVGAASLLMKYQGLLNAISLVSIFVFLATGVFLLAGKEKYNYRPVKNGRLFLEGFFAGITNPQLFIFWIGVSSLLINWSFLKTNNILCTVAFVSGAAAGAFFLQFFLIRLSHNNSFFSNVKSGVKWNRVTGAVFIIFAIISAIRIL